MMKWIGLGIGLGIGLSLAYGLFVSETARLLVAFFVGALVFGGVVLLTAMLVNRQWTRALGAPKTTHNYRYPGAPPVQMGAMPQRQPDLLPPPPFEIISPPVGIDTRQNVDDEVVA